MAKSEQQKGKLLVLKDLLERKSDCDHPLSMQDILSHLESRGITAERKSIYSDLETLREQDARGVAVCPWPAAEEPCPVPTV